jgi:hypothetical protein
LATQEIGKKESAVQKHAPIGTSAFFPDISKKHQMFGHWIFRARRATEGDIP